MQKVACIIKHRRRIQQLKYGENLSETREGCGE